MTVVWSSEEPLHLALLRCARSFRRLLFVTLPIYTGRVGGLLLDSRWPPSLQGIARAGIVVPRPVEACCTAGDRRGAGEGRRVLGCALMSIPVRSASSRPPSTLGVGPGESWVTWVSGITLGSGRTAGAGGRLKAKKS